MTHVRPIATGLLTLFTLCAEAGITYHFSTKSTAALKPGSSGRAWIAGDRKRVELDADPTKPRTYDIVIASGGKTTFINLQNKTYFYEHKVQTQATVRSSGLFHLPWPDDRIKGQPRITYRDAGAGAIVGEYATTEHVVSIAYGVIAEFQGVSLQGKVEATVSVLVAPTLPRGTDPKLVRTGFQEIDDKLISWVSALDGMIVGSKVSISRTLDDGPVITEITTMSIDELKVMEVDDSIFAIPSGLTYQEPIYGVPGQ